MIRFEARPNGLPLGAVFLACGLVAGVAVGLLHLDQIPVALCTFKAATGLPCLTCGTTRVLGHLFALDLKGALEMNPLAAFGALVLLAWGMADLVLWLRGRAVAIRVSGRAAQLLRGMAVTALALNWVYLVAAGR